MPPAHHDQDGGNPPPPAWERQITNPKIDLDSFTFTWGGKNGKDILVKHHGQPIGSMRDGEELGIIALSQDGDFIGIFDQEEKALAVMIEFAALAAANPGADGWNLAGKLSAPPYATVAP